jgi:hypothetical protein
MFLKSLVASLSVFFPPQTFFFWVQLKVWIYLFVACPMCFSTSIITWKFIFEKKTSFGIFFWQCHHSLTRPIGRKLNFYSQHPLACLLTLHHHCNFCPFLAVHIVPHHFLVIWSSFSLFLSCFNYFPIVPMSKFFKEYQNNVTLSPFMYSFT